ncbi:MAG: hypothetical protein GY851_05290 [bacterium]|nr:hypothetical protein [bacterium]
MDDAIPSELRRHQHLYDRLAREGAELVYVLGPKDDGLDGHYWVGAVLRVSASEDGLPTLAQALLDDLFPPGNARHLVKWDLNRVSPGAAQEARSRTARALRCMRARAQGEVIPSPPPPEPREPEVEEEPMSEAERQAVERAAEYARNTKLKFERVYAAAQKALEDGFFDTALVKCRAALDLLAEGDVYGEAQGELAAAIHTRVQELSERTTSRRE